MTSDRTGGLRTGTKATIQSNHFNRSLRRAYTDQRPLIYFYGLSAGVYEALFPVYVVEDHPDELTVLVSPDVAGLGDASLLHGGSETPLKRYVTRTVKQRLHQHRFRELVLGAYAHRCTVCSLGARDRLVPLLDAAHILPDHDERGLPEIPNGLSLCKIHHSAYDLNILGIAPDLRVHVREDILAERDGPMLQHGIKEMEGRDDRDAGAGRESGRTLSIWRSGLGGSGRRRRDHVTARVLAYGRGLVASHAST